MCRRRLRSRGGRWVRLRGRVERCPGAAGPCCRAPGIRPGRHASVPRRRSARDQPAVLCSMNTSTYSRFSSTVSACRNRRRRNGKAELYQLAVDPAVYPQRILLRQPKDKAGGALDSRRPSGLAPFPRVVFDRGQLALPGQQRRGCYRETCPAPAGDEPGQRGEPHLISRFVPHPADVTAQHRILVAEHQQLSILGPVATEHQGSHAEYPACQQVDDLEQHPASQPSRHQVCWR